MLPSSRSVWFLLPVVLTVVSPAQEAASQTSPWGFEGRCGVSQCLSLENSQPGISLSVASLYSFSPSFSAGLRYSSDQAESMSNDESDDRIQSLGLMFAYRPDWAISPSITLAIGGTHGAASGSSSSWYFGVELAGGLSVAATPTLAVFSDVSLITSFGGNGFPELWVVGRVGVKIAF